MRTILTIPLTWRPAWKPLERHARKVHDVHLRTLFADDPDRGERLTAGGAGLEHSVLTQGAIWNVNPFDQSGVELSKALAQAIVPDLGSPAEPAVAHDSSANGLIRRYRTMKGSA